MEHRHETEAREVEPTKEEKIEKYNHELKDSVEKSHQRLEADMWRFREQENSRRERDEAIESVRKK